MASSGNTFGTFLQTFGTLEKQSKRSASPASEPNMFDLVQELAKRGDRVPIKTLPWYADNPKAVFDTIFEGQSKGVLTIEEDRGEPVATLTSLGRSFAAA